MQKSQFIAGVAFTLCALGGWVRAEDASQIQQYNGISYVSGGVGEGERDRIGALASDYSLKLVMAEKDGAYVANANIVVTDARGHRILEATAAGPLFFAKLPAGRYKVEATLDGQTLRRSLDVSGDRQRRVDLRWD